jgi:hypothetical protein
MKESAASAGGSFKPTTIHRKRIQKDVCYIGKLIRVSQRAITIQSITHESGVRKAVQAMGGSLSLVAKFPDRAPVVLSGIAEAGAAAKPTRRKHARDEN